MNILETKNFFLWRCTTDDVSAYLKFWTDPEVMKFIGDGTLGGGEDKVERALKSNILACKKYPQFGFGGLSRRFPKN